MKKTAFATALLPLACLYAAMPTVVENSVTMEQNDLTRLVTVRYEIADAPAIVTMDVQTNRGDGVYASIGAANFTRLWGDVNRYVGIGTHEISWQPVPDWPDVKISLEEGGVRAVVTAWATNFPPDYAVIDLAVSNNVRFYVSKEAIPYGGPTNNIYKSDYLVMRKIPAAGVRWRQGSPATETGRAVKYETLRYVTMSNDYYMAIYETTWGQWRKIISTKPSNASLNWDAEDAPLRPANAVSWQALRGSGASYDWPTSGHAVDATTYLGKLRAYTSQGFEFDLPTSAQWEYACRAGTFTALNNDSNTNYDEVAWCTENTGDGSANSGVEQQVGLKKPNNWGLYDMHGLHREWCLDYAPASGYTRSDAEVFEPAADCPGGGVSATHRVWRGGTYRDSWTEGRSAYWNSQTQDYTHARYGFRMACPAVYAADK